MDKSFASFSKSLAKSGHSGIDNIADIEHCHRLAQKADMDWVLPPLTILGIGLPKINAQPSTSLYWDTAIDLWFKPCASFERGADGAIE